MPNKKEYIKQNTRPLKIYYAKKENKGEESPYFNWQRRRKYLNDFIRTHDNPWDSNIPCPEYIHGYDSSDYYDPIFIELTNDETINVYRRL